MERREFLTSSVGGLAALALPGVAEAGAGGLGASGLGASGLGDAAFVGLADQLFYDALPLSPEQASATGFDKGARAALKSRLDDRSKAGLDQRIAWHRAALARLAAVDRAGLSAPVRRQLDLAIYTQNRPLLTAHFGIASVQRPYVLSQSGGAYFEVPDFLDSRHTVATAEDGEAYLARLAGLPHAIEQDSARQADLAPRGLVAPVWALDMALGQMRALRAPAPAQSSMATSLARRAAAKGIAGDWGGRAAAIIAEALYPALDRQIAFVEALRAQAPKGDGAWRIKDGEAIYAAALAEATTTSLTPDEVHRIGLAQVAELTAQLDGVLRAAGLTTGSVGARLTALNRRPDQLYPNTDEGRAALLASLNAGVAAMRERLPRAFDDVPADPLEIRRVPREIQDGAPNGYYYRAPLDGSRPAIYWINLRDTADWPKYGLPDLTYHEGVPGHHLQLSYVNHAGHLPLLLRNVFNSAYTEGWALYAEQLAGELGAFSGIEQAGYLQSMLFRATRLVVDTGLHQKRWSRQQATAYMAETTGFPIGRSASEVDRYICMIGQACSYKIGHNMWVRLRERAQRQLGDRFQLGWFHEILKEGILPLAMLEQRVDQRIAERLKAQS